MTPLSSGGDLAEWQECRSTIGRLDGTIADLRKFGFSLVTVLISASSFFGQHASPSESTMAEAIVIMILIAALFAVDRYYTLLLNGAVERALDLEGPKIDRQDLSKDKLTQVISIYAINSVAVFIAPLLYLAFLWATTLLELAQARAPSTKLYAWFGGCLTFILVYFFYTEWKAKTGFFSNRRS
jgi:hypothetical protein